MNSLVQSFLPPRDGTPEGVEYAPCGWCVVDSRAGHLYIKQSGPEVNTGWVRIAGISEVVSGGGAGLTGEGAPEGVVTASPGTVYLDKLTRDIWIKETGTGNTGWI